MTEGCNWGAMPPCRPPLDVSSAGASGSHSNPAEREHSRDVRVTDGFQVNTVTEGFISYTVHTTSRIVRPTEPDINSHTPIKI